MTSGYTNSAPQITRGIVLRTIKHTEGRLIVRMCTERFGTRGVVVRAGRKGTAQAALQLARGVAGEREREHRAGFGRAREHPVGDAPREHHRLARWRW